MSAGAGILLYELSGEQVSNDTIVGGEIFWWETTSDAEVQYHFQPRCAIFYETLIVEDGERAMGSFYESQKDQETKGRKNPPDGSELLKRWSRQQYLMPRRDGEGFKKPCCQESNELAVVWGYFTQLIVTTIVIENLMLNSTSERLASLCTFYRRQPTSWTNLLIEYTTQCRRNCDKARERTPARSPNAASSWRYSKNEQQIFVVDNIDLCPMLLGEYSTSQAFVSPKPVSSSPKRILSAFQDCCRAGNFDSTHMLVREWTLTISRHLMTRIEKTHNMFLSAVLAPVRHI